MTERARVEEISRRPWVLLALLAITLITAATLRLSVLERAPAGLDADEGSNAWNAWCLLQTGRDEHGKPWPIVESVGFGQGMTTLYLYVLLPFYRVLGLSIWSTRLPAAIAGVLTVVLLYFIGSRLFDRSVGVAAAALLAISPWHLQQSRWGHPATMFPLAVEVLFASMLWAGFPLTSRMEGRPFRAAIGGFATGIFLYGYQGIRLWMPLFLLTLIVATWPAWRRFVTTRRGFAAVLSFATTAAITVAPLLIETLRDPLLRRRAVLNWVWNASDSLPMRAGKVLARYLPHYDLDFLFRKGDGYPCLWPPPGWGLFLWFTLPLMIIGAGWVIVHRRVVEARVVGAAIVSYPFADLLNEHYGPHSLRSLPGVIALTLLAAIGLVALYRYCARMPRVVGVTIAALVSMLAVSESVKFTRDYFGTLDQSSVRFNCYAADLVDVCLRFKTRMDQYDAIFVTGNSISNPYVYTLVLRQYPPQRWFADPKIFRHGRLPNGWFRNEEVCLRYGKFHFFFPGASDGELERLSGNPTPERVLLVLRPGELSTMSLPPPIYRVHDSTGREALWVIETKL